MNLSLGVFFKANYVLFELKHNCFPPTRTQLGSGKSSYCCDTEIQVIPKYMHVCVPSCLPARTRISVCKDVSFY